MIRISTDQRCSASLADLRRDHSVIDLIDMMEVLDWRDDAGLEG